jgi:predicted DNA binding protein
VIEAPVETDLRELWARLGDTVASLEVQSVTEHERAPQRAQPPHGLLGLLTDRQQDAITAAYRAGYYDWPRQSTSEEIAATLDIVSSPDAPGSYA